MRIAALIVVIVLLGFGTALLIQRTSEEAGLLVGGVFVLIGLAMLVLSRRQLGNSFSVSPQATSLVTHGLYGRIPHPMYVFLDLALLGGILMLHRPWLLAVLGILVLTQAWQSGREARVLDRAFGDAYREYRKHTWW
jgi:protein-S-isoprenylcysteine O-methyltransferase Ste14